MFRDVPRCSGMFRNVPPCSGMFHVPGFIDGLQGCDTLKLFPRSSRVRIPKTLFFKKLPFLTNCTFNFFRIFQCERLNQLSTAKTQSNVFIFHY